MFNQIISYEKSLLYCNCVYYGFIWAIHAYVCAVLTGYFLTSTQRRQPYDCLPEYQVHQHISTILFWYSDVVTNDL